MFGKPLTRVLFLANLGLCATPPNLLDTGDLSQGSIVTPVLTFSLNSSATADNTSFGGLLKLRCDPVRYGRNLNVESCRKVFNYMKEDDTVILFADRSSTQAHDLGLPFRVTSSKSLNISSTFLIAVLKHKARVNVLTCRILNR